MTYDDEDEIDDKVVMSNDNDEVEVKQPLIEEADIDTNGMDKQTEIVEEEVEAELSATQAYISVNV